MRGRGSTVKVGYCRIKIDEKKYIYEEKKRTPRLVEEKEYNEKERTKNKELMGETSRRK